MFKKVDKLVLRGSVWLRATGQIGKQKLTQYYRSVLFNERSRRMCCVGVYGAACGIPKRLLEGCGTPGGAVDSLDRALDKEHLDDARKYRDMAVWGNFYEANDDPNTTDEQKIELLTPLFATEGIELEFRPDL